MDAESLTVHLERLKESFLLAAARGGRVQECASLLDLGAEVDFVRCLSDGDGDGKENDGDGENEGGDTPLLAAVRAGHKDVASVLLAHGADPGRRAAWGDTALHLAAAAGDGDMCDLLLGGGCRVDVRNGAGLSPADVAAERGYGAIRDRLEGPSSGRSIGNVDDDSEEDEAEGCTSGPTCGCDDDEDAEEIRLSQSFAEDEVQRRSIDCASSVSSADGPSSQASLNLIETSLDRERAGIVDDCVESEAVRVGNCCPPATETSAHDDSSATCSIDGDNISSGRPVDREPTSSQLDDLFEMVKLLYSQNVTLGERERAAKAALSRTEGNLRATEASLERLRRECESLREEIGSYFDDDAALSGMSLLELESMEDRLRKALGRIVDQKEQAMRDRLEEEEGKTKCVICQVETKSVVFMPCRHLCVCQGCSRRHELDRCPLCRMKVSERIDVYA